MWDNSSERMNQNDIKKLGCKLFTYWRNSDIVHCCSFPPHQLDPSLSVSKLIPADVLTKWNPVALCSPLTLLSSDCSELLIPLPFELAFLLLLWLGISLSDWDQFFQWAAPTQICASLPPTRTRPVLHSTEFPFLALFWSPGCPDPYLMLRSSRKSSGVP